MTSVSTSVSASRSPGTRVAVSTARSPVFLGLLSVAAVLVAWELVGRATGGFASYPSAVVAALGGMVTGDRVLLTALRETLLGMAAGFAVAGVLGVALGFAMGRVRWVAGVVEPYINAIYATPRIALVPLLILWFGIGFQLRVTVAVLTAIFPIIINTYVGVSSVDRGILDVGRSFNASRTQLLRTVVLPASLPQTLVGLRIGGFRALVGVIVAEMTASVSGTGRLLLESGRYLQTDRLIGAIFVLGCIGLAFMTAMRAAEGRFLPGVKKGRG